MTWQNVPHFLPANSRIMFVYDVIGNMAGNNKRWHQRRFEPSQEMGVKKMINRNLSSELISLWFASIDGGTSAIQNCVSPLVFTFTKSTGIVTLQDVQPLEDQIQWYI